MANEVDEWGRECELNPPRLVHFDSWGGRVDHIVTSPAWKRMKDLSAQEGLVAIGYERSFGEWRFGELAVSFLNEHNYFLFYTISLEVAAYETVLCVHCSRVYQMSKLFLFSPSSGLYTCPLAMTDGAAKVIQVCLFII